MKAVDGFGTWIFNLTRDKFKDKPFVVNLSNHERLNRLPFDRLRANG